MACAGELPPNTRSGQLFIHDPKVAGETEVKAQIKLRFMTSTGTPVVIIRSFQASLRICGTALTSPLAPTPTPPCPASATCPTA